jgi:hypothetical protein
MRAAHWNALQIIQLNQLVDVSRVLSESTNAY